MEAQLENFPGNLSEAYQQIKRGTGRHFDQLSTERRMNHELRDLHFYTVDGNIYRLNKKGKPEWDITRELQNPVLGNIAVAYQQILNEQNYRPSRKEVERALQTRSTVKVDLTQLALEKVDEEFSFLSVSTSEYDALNVEERKAAERIFGKGKEFIANMRMFSDEANLSVVKIFVLNPDYVEKEAKTSPVGRASWVVSFDYDSNANAVGRNVDSHGRLRGVRRKVAEGAAEKNEVPSAPQERKETKNSLDSFLQQHHLSREQLDQAVKLYSLVQKIKV